MKKLLTIVLMALAILSGASYVHAAPVTGTIAGPYDPIALVAVAPAYGDSVVFDVVSSASMPWVENQCFVDGTLVYSDIRGYFPSYYRSQMFTLGFTGLWQSGPADCIATLFRISNGHRRTLDSVTYHVNA
jgi:hypothetical protein